MNEFIKRSFTAIIFAGVMIMAIYYSGIAYSVLFGLILLAGIWEYLSMANKTGEKIISYDLTIVTLFCGISIYLNVLLSRVLFIESIIYAAPLFLFLPFLFALYSKRENVFRQVGYSLMAVIHVAVPLALLHYVAVEKWTYTGNIVLGLLFLTWINDTMAYITGSLLGRHKLFPSVSPKKTWEGAAGAFAFTALAGYGMSFLFPELTKAEWTGSAMIIVVFGTIGDLTVSLLKRQSGVKDTGFLFPGHGGILDRFDGFLFMIPFVLTFIAFMRMI